MEYRMLVVDDEEKVTQTLKSTFIQQGYNVITAGNGKEANRIIDQNPLDLILLDIEMPEVSGLEVLERVKKTYPDTKVIIITGFGEYEDKARKLKCDAFIKKPFAVSQLKDTVESLLKKKDYEEIKSYSLGTENFAQKGSPVADILMIEPTHVIAQVISSFLSDRSKSKGLYKVYAVEDKEQALAVQETLYTSIVLLDLRTVQDPGEIMNTLMKTQYPPKDFIFYFKPNVPLKDLQVEESKYKHWDGSLMNDKSLEELAGIIRKSAIQHNLIKE